jgi:hypothetical protein
MGIKLDWEVESEGGWSEIGEDPTEIAARQRRWRRWRTTTIVVLGGSALIGAFVAARLYITGQQLRGDLEATIAAETTALRLSDREAFMVIQDSAAGWKDVQTATFDHYTSGGLPLEVTGQIIELEITDPHAHAVLRERLGGQDVQVVWFYEHFAGGWKHVSPDVSFWGNAAKKVTLHIDYYYYTKDEVFTESLSGRMNSWWESACRLLNCADQPPRMSVRIEPDPLLKVGQAEYDPSTLLIPSPLLGRSPLDGSLDPLLLNTLAGFMAEHWAATLVPLDGSQSPDSDATWLRSEVSLWLRSQFAPDSGVVAPVLGPLFDKYGQAAGSAFIARVRAGESVQIVLNDLTGNTAQMPTVGMETYFTQRLQSELELIRQGNAVEAMLLFSDPQRDRTRELNYLASLGPSADRLQVVSTRSYAGLVWAETHIITHSDSGQDVTWVTYEPFRMLENRWVHTIPLIAEWGEVKEDRRSTVIVRYYDLDSPSVAGLADTLEGLYTRTASDLGVGTDSLPYIGVQIYIPGPGLASNTRPVATAAGAAAQIIQVNVTSPYGSIHTADQSASQFLADQTAYKMVLELVGYLVHPVNINSPLPAAIASVEARQLGLKTISYPPGSEIGDTMLNATYGDGTSKRPPRDIEELWATPDAFNTPGYRDYLSAEALIEVLVEQFGAETLPALITNLPISASVEDWLMRSLNIHTRQIEAEWRIRAAIRISEHQ